MPEKHVVSDFGVVRFLFVGSIDFIDLAYFDGTVIAFGVIKVFFQKGVFFGFIVNCFDIAAEFFIILV